jgi:hypothetical protein
MALRVTYCSKFNCSSSVTFMGSKRHLHTVLTSVNSSGRKLGKLRRNNP